MRHALTLGNKGSDHQNFCDTYLLASKAILQLPSVLGPADHYAIANLLNQLTVRFLKNAPPKHRDNLGPLVDGYLPPALPDSANKNSEDIRDATKVCNNADTAVEPKPTQLIPVAVEESSVAIVIDSDANYQSLNCSDMPPHLNYKQNSSPEVVRLLQILGSDKGRSPLSIPLEIVRMSHEMLTEDAPTRWKNDYFATCEH